MVSLRLILFVCGTVLIYGTNNGFPLPPSRSTENTVDNGNTNSPSQPPPSSGLGSAASVGGNTNINNNNNIHPPSSPSSPSNVFSGIRPLRPLEQIPPQQQPPPLMNSGSGTPHQNSHPNDGSSTTPSMADQLLSSYQSTPGSSSSGSTADTNTNNYPFSSSPGSFNGPPVAPPGSQRIINNNNNNEENTNYRNNRPPPPPIGGQPPRKLPSIFHQNMAQHHAPPQPHTPPPSSPLSSATDTQTSTTENTEDNNDGTVSASIADSQSRATQIPTIPVPSSTVVLPTSSVSSTVTVAQGNSHPNNNNNNNVENTQGLSRTTNNPSNTPNHGVPSGTVASTTSQLQQHSTASSSSFSPSTVPSPSLVQPSSFPSTTGVPVSTLSSAVPSVASSTVAVTVTETVDPVSEPTEAVNPAPEEPVSKEPIVQSVTSEDSVVDQTTDDLSGSRTIVSNEENERNETPDSGGDKLNANLATEDAKEASETPTEPDQSNPSSSLAPPPPPSEEYFDLILDNVGYRDGVAYPLKKNDEGEEQALPASNGDEILPVDDGSVPDNTALPNAALSSLNMYREENSLEDNGTPLPSEEKGIDAHAQQILEEYLRNVSARNNAAAQGNDEDNGRSNGGSGTNAQGWDMANNDAYEQAMQNGWTTNNEENSATAADGSSASTEGIPSSDTPVSAGDNPYYYENDYAIYMTDEETDYDGSTNNNYGGDIGGEESNYLLPNHTTNDVAETSTVTITEESMQTIAVGPDGDSLPIHSHNGWPVPPGHHHGHNHPHHPSHDHHHGHYHYEQTEPRDNRTESVNHSSSIDDHPFRETTVISTAPNATAPASSSTVNATVPTTATFPSLTGNKTIPSSSFTGNTSTDPSTTTSVLSTDCQEQIRQLQQNLTRAQQSLNFLPAMKTSIYAWGNFVVILLQQIEPYTGPIVNTLGMLYEEHIEPLTTMIDSKLNDALQAIVPYKETVFSAVESELIGSGGGNKYGNPNESVSKVTSQHIRYVLDGIYTSFTIVFIYYLLRIWFKVLFLVFTCGGLCCCCCPGIIDDDEDDIRSNKFSTDNVNALANTLPPIPSPPRPQGPPKTTNTMATPAVPATTFGFPPSTHQPGPTSTTVPPTTNPPKASEFLNPVTNTATTATTVPSKPETKPTNASLVLPPENVLKQSLHLMSPEVQNKVLSLLASPGGVRSTMKRKAVVGGVDNPNAKSTLATAVSNTTNVVPNPPLPPSAFATTGPMKPPAHPISALTSGETMAPTPEKNNPSSTQTHTMTSFGPSATSTAEVTHTTTGNAWGKSTTTNVVTTASVFGPPRPASKSTGSTSSHHSHNPKAPWEGAVPSIVEESTTSGKDNAPVAYSSVSNVEGSHTTATDTMKYSETGTYGNHSSAPSTTANNLMDSSYTLPSMDTTATVNENEYYTDQQQHHQEQQQQDPYYAQQPQQEYEQQQQQQQQYDQQPPQTYEDISTIASTNPDYERQLYVQEQQALGRPYDYLGEFGGKHYYGYQRLIDKDQGSIPDPIYLEERTTGPV